MERRSAVMGLGFADALRVKSAELWLEVGEPNRAVRELGHVSPSGCRHPWTVSVLAHAAESLETGRMILDNLAHRED